MRRVLLISPCYPPMAVPGARRALNLTRNLPEAGWKPVILAAPPINERQDQTLADGIPPDAIVNYGFSGVVRPWLASRAKARAGKGAVRANRPSRPPWRALLDGLPVDTDAIDRVAETVGGAVEVVGDAVGAALKSAVNIAGQALPDRDWSFLTPFDRYIADLPSGLEAARILIHQHAPAAIHICAEPWSPLIAAVQLARETRLPLVVDFREPWSLHAARMAQRSLVARRALERFEYEVFQTAARIVLHTDACRDAYVQAYAGRIPEARFVAVRDAFDPELFAPPTALDHDPRGPFTVLHLGRLRRDADVDPLLEGFARFVRAEGLDPARARLTVIGGLDDAQAERATALGLHDHLFAMPEVSALHCMPVMRAADLLALVIPSDHRLRIPARLYDCLCAGRPVLAVSDNAEARRIVHEAGAGSSLSHGDPAAIAATIGDAFRASRSARAPGIDPAAREPFTARAQARRMADIYRAIT